jgi:hypothetical protein
MAKRKLLDLLNGRPPGPKVLRIAKPSRRERIVKLFTGLRSQRLVGGQVAPPR